jgi:uncharacterized membrane protein (DUF4010 family)
VLPDYAIDPWGLINPREAWLTIVVIAALGFVNYVLLKIYSSRGLYYSALLGGLVNSTATIAELSGFLKSANAHRQETEGLPRTSGSLPDADSVLGQAPHSQGQTLESLAIVIDLLTVMAMFLRNLLILAIFARGAVAKAAVPLAAMSLVAFLCIWRQRKHQQTEIGELKLSSPLSLPKVFKFGFIFLVIEIIGTIGQRYLGHFGFLLVSVIGGLVSSASTAGAAATLAMHNKITMQTAGLATVLTSMASALSNLPLLHQQIRQWTITRKLILLSFGIVAVGVVTTLFFGLPKS